MIQRWLKVFVIAVSIISLPGCAIKFSPEQELIPYMPVSQAEPYPVAFEVGYSNPFPGADSLAAIEQKLPPSEDGVLPYIIELRYGQFIERFRIDMRVWSAGEIINEEVVHARASFTSGRPEATAKARAEFYHLAAGHFAQIINGRVRDGYPDYLEAISSRKEDDLRAYLAANRNSLFYHSALSVLGNHAPAGERRTAWHLANKKQYPGYEMAQPDELRLWLSGPEGFSFWEIQQALEAGASQDELLVDVLEARAFSIPEIHPGHRYGPDEFETIVGAVYSPELIRFIDFWELHDEQSDLAWQDYGYTNLITQFRYMHQVSGLAMHLSANQAQQLMDAGISEQLILAGNLSDDRYGEVFSNWRYQRLDPADYIASLPIPGTGGNYLSPYTDDEVVAEWVNQAINARMGATVGSTLGAVAGAQLGRNLPVPGGQFIGGMLGSATGQSAGREAAIQSLGGWDFIRATSDYSFTNVRDMAEYLVYQFGDRSDFMDVIAAASALYPALIGEVQRMVQASNT